MEVSKNISNFYYNGSSTEDFWVKNTRIQKAVSCCDILVARLTRRSSDVVEEMDMTV